MRAETGMMANGQYTLSVYLTPSEADALREVHALEAIVPVPGQQVGGIVVFLKIEEAV